MVHEAYDSTCSRVSMKNNDMMTPPTTSVVCSEIFSGSLTMLDSVCGGGGRKNLGLRVVMKVHKTTIEHFAVVFPEKVICKPIGFINLKNCTVECLRNSGCKTLQIVQKSCDGGVLTFRADSALDAKKWLDVLQSKLSSNKITSTSYRCRDPEQLLNTSLPNIIEEGDEE